MSHQFSRVERLMGPVRLERIRQSRVAVVGLGAVGSYVVEALARAGVGALRLVDFDVVQPSNINRQLLALHSTVGRPKAELAAGRVRDIFPGCRAEPLRLFAHRDTLDAVFTGGLDLVLDAIDSVTPKVELIAGALGRGLPIMSSMGAALRTDPSAVRFGPLSASIQCPLASRIRKLLRRRGCSVEFPCVYSVEQLDRAERLARRSRRAEGGAAPEPAEAGPREAPLLDDGGIPFNLGRTRRALGSLPTMTGIMGLTLAHEALRFLAGGSFDNGEIT